MKQIFLFILKVVEEMPVTILLENMASTLGLIDLEAKS